MKNKIKTTLKNSRKFYDVRYGDVHLQIDFPKATNGFEQTLQETILSSINKEIVIYEKGNRPLELLDPYRCGSYINPDAILAFNGEVTDGKRSALSEYVQHLRKNDERGV